MSRSRKKPYYKDVGFMKDCYWKIIRRIHKQQLKRNWDNPDFSFKNPKVIINDYDYSDYWFYIKESPQSARGKWWSNNIGSTKEDVKKYSRK